MCSICRREAPMSCCRSATRALASFGVLAAILAGCSDAHTDRRQYISLATGDAVATNKMAHIVNPWPPASQNREIAYNGEKMQTAVERYRTGRIIAPVNATT